MKKERKNESLDSFVSYTPYKHSTLDLAFGSYESVNSPNQRNTITRQPKQIQTKFTYCFSCALHQFNLLHIKIYTYHGGMVAVELQSYGTMDSGLLLCMYIE